MLRIEIDLRRGPPPRRWVQATSDPTEMLLTPGGREADAVVSRPIHSGWKPPGVGRRRWGNSPVTPSRFSRCRPCGSCRGSNDCLETQLPLLPALRARGALDRRVFQPRLPSIRVPAFPSMAGTAARQPLPAGPNGPAGLREGRDSIRAGNARPAPGLPPNPHVASCCLRQRAVAG